MIEVIIVAFLVVWSALVVFKKVFPKSAYAVFSKLSRVCQSQGWSSLAKWLSPAMVTGCGGSCDCSSNDKTESPTPEIQAVKWK